MLNIKKECIMLCKLGVIKDAKRPDNLHYELGIMCLLHGFVCMRHIFFFFCYFSVFISLCRLSEHLFVDNASYLRRSSVLGSLTAKSIYVAQTAVLV